MEKMSLVPGSEEEWNQLIKANKLNRNASIHDRKYTDSASNISMNQFLLLRIQHEVDSSHTSTSKLAQFLDPALLESAEQHLGTVNGWKSYLKSVEDQSDRHQDSSRYQSLSTYALVREFQRQTLQFKEEFNSTSAKQKITMFPAGDGKTPSEQDDQSDPPSPSPSEQFTRQRPNQQKRPAQTPLKSSRPAQSTRGSQSTVEVMRDLSIQTEEEMSTPEWYYKQVYKPFVAIPPVAGPAAKDSSVDEQIVNTALFSFAQAVILHCPEIKADWSLHRAPLVFTDKRGRKVYEARVDGVLRLAKNNRILAIMEVKPFARMVGTGTVGRDIVMQEGAQIVAWISEDPPKHVNGRPV